MSILAVAAELEDFDSQTGDVANGVESSFDPGYARGHVEVGFNGATVTKTFTRQTSGTFWLTALTKSVYFSSGLVGRFLMLLDGSDERLGLRTTEVGGIGRVQLIKYDGADETVLQTSTSIGLGDAVRLDICVSGYGASNRVRVWTEVDGGGTQSLEIDYTGDLTDGGSTGLDGVKIGAITKQEDLFVGSLIVADQDTRRMRLATLVPDGAGASNTFTSGAYSDVDEMVTNTADKLVSGTAAQVFQATVTADPAGTWDVLAVQVSAVASCDEGGGPQSLAIGVRDGSTDDWGDDQSLDGSWQTYRRLMSTNPVTSAAWEQSELADLQIGVRSGA